MERVEIFLLKNKNPQNVDESPLLVAGILFQDSGGNVGCNEELLNGLDNTIFFFFLVGFTKSESRGTVGMQQEDFAITVSLTQISWTERRTLKLFVMCKCNCTTFVLLSEF